MSTAMRDLISGEAELDEEEDDDSYDEDTGEQRRKERVAIEDSSDEDDDEDDDEEEARKVRVSERLGTKNPRPLTMPCLRFAKASS